MAKFSMNLNISNLTLHHLVEENQVLVNGFINKVQTTPEGFLKLKIHTKNGDKNLLVNEKAIFIAQNSINAKQNPGGFSAFLKKYIFNQRIVSLKQKEFDRIIIMEFPDVLLIFELFSKGNIILVGKEMKILRAMKKEKWKDRELKKGEIYKFPSSRGKNPLEISEKYFLKELNNNQKTVFGAIIEILNVAPGILDFIFEDNNFNKKEDAKNINPKKAKIILKKIKESYSKKEEGVFLKEDTIYSIDIGGKPEYSSINEILNKKAFVFEDKTEKKEIKKNIERKEDYLAMIKKAENNEKEFKEAGEKIYLEYSLLEQVIKAIKKLRNNGLDDRSIENKILPLENRIKEIKIERDKFIIEI